MKKLGLLSLFSLCLALIFSSSMLKTQGYKVGDTAIDFSLKNVDGKMVSLKNFKDAKGFIVIFTCNHCPFAKAAEDRIIALDKKYAAKGFPVVAINPNDAADYPEDSFDNMKARSQEKSYTFPYLLDDTQSVAKTYGAMKTPHVYLLDKSRVVKYIGAIDDNTRDASAVKKTYLANAIDALLQGKEIKEAQTSAVGCGIKWKKAN